MKGMTAMTNQTEMAAPLSLFDSDRYPIHDLASKAGRDFVDAARREFEQNSLITLREFLRPEVAARITAQALDDAKTGSHRFTGTSDVFSKSEADVERRTGLTYTKTDLPYDRIASDSPALALFRWDGVLEFISTVVGVPVYRSADPLGAAVIQIQNDGDQQDWHFDISEFTILLHAQAPRSGGALQYVVRARDQMLRDPKMIERIAAGDPSIEIRELATIPGTLVLHAGNISMHRVTPTHGPVPRVNATLAFNSKPGAQLNEYTRMLHFGRNG